MRRLFFVGVLAASAISADVKAQYDEPSKEPVPNRRAVESSEEYQSRVQAWFLDCTQSWDSGTHMTKQQWERSCLRAAEERVKFLMQHPDPAPGKQ